MNDDNPITPLVFEIGKTVETSQEAFEHEKTNLEAAKNAFAMAVKTLEDYRKKMLEEMLASKLPIKEIELGKTYVSRCIELVQNLCITAEQKKLRAEGAVVALDNTVKQIKNIYDRELLKQKQQTKQLLVETANVISEDELKKENLSRKPRTRKR